MKASILTLLIFLSATAFSQTTITGKITDKKGNLLCGSNIFFKNTYIGVSADANGKYLITTDLTGKQTIVVSFIGYKSFEKEAVLDKSNISLDFVLKEKPNSLNTVNITAGVFEASDEKKGVALKPLDIVTTASSVGDIYGALRTLPGVQTVGEDGRLFVRGGESYETKNFIDGMLVQNSNAYSSSMPDLPSRGRFSPNLFKGTSFNSGAYSAEYGQALSSALILKTEGLAEKTQTGLSLLTIGTGISHTKRWDNTSLSVSSGYNNLQPYYNAVNQDVDWEKYPESLTGTVIFRQKVRDEGMLKMFSTFGKDNAAMLFHNIDNNDSTILINRKNNNNYLNTTYNDVYNDWLVKAGVSYSSNFDNIDLAKDNLKDKEQTLQSRFTLSNQVTDFVKIKFGGDFLNKKYNQDYFQNFNSNTYSNSFDDNNSAFFVETNLQVNSLLAARVGARFEYSSLLNKTNIAPRFSLSVKISKHSQLSLATGIFYQTPQNDYLRFNHNLDFEKAYHYVLNYQIMTKHRTFRVEGYYKDYDNLVKYETGNSSLASSYNNSGDGYARGIDVFYRDKKILKYGDFWVSYSLLDTERDFKNYPKSAVPTFVSKHNLAVVYKYFIMKINTQVGFTYSLSSGRTYYNPNTVDFLSDKTKAYQDLSFSASYLTTIMNCFTIVHFSVSNVLANDNVFGYRYGTVQNTDGSYNSRAVTPMAKRFLLLAVFVSI
ncbi:MAG: TonB-dependent receptor [Bacteroidetes bacterium]|nr:TonB-dependent receptor [Bacteroidota bacterium]